MNAAVMMVPCPTEETLAAFIDQELDPASRLEVVRHLAECGDCQDMVEAANEYQSETGTAAQKVVPGPFGRPVVWGSLAAAAVLVGVLFGVPSIRQWILPPSPMEELVAAANDLPERPVAARLSGDFSYKGHTTHRGGNAEPIGATYDAEQAHAKLQAEFAAWNAIQRADKSKSSAKLHAAGVAHLLLGVEQRDAAVLELTKAAQANPASAPILSDLAAAYIARGAKGDYERALEAANAAWQLEPGPAAAWNRAMALSRLDRNEAAVAAWNDYLKLDPDSPWSKEVRDKHLPLLTEP